MRIVTPHAALTAALLLAALPAGAQSAGSRYSRAVLSGANEVPPTASTASGVTFGFLDGTQLTLTGRFRGLEADYTMSHIHVGAAGTVGSGIVFVLDPTVDGDLRGGRFLPGSNTFSLTSTQVSTLLAENYYVNVHSTAFPAGEIRDQLRPALVLSEIRVDQTGTDNDEYFELEGAPGASLDGYTYVVIGGGTDGVGVIESVTDLAGSSLPDDGIFFAAEHTYSLGGTPDLTLHDGLNFEDSEPVTHLLVQGFTGTNGQDLDTDDDGDLDVMPWSSISDAIGLVDESTDLAYGDFLGYEDVGPDGASPPGHVFRAGDTGAWAIGAFDPNGGNDTPGTVNDATPTAGEPTPGAPTGYALSVAYPNPFNPATTLPYTMAVAGPARLAVYDVLGREVAVLVDAERKAGPHEVTLDGSRLPAGTYLLRLEAGGEVHTRRVTLVR